MKDIITLAGKGQVALFKMADSCTNGNYLLCVLFKNKTLHCNLVHQDDGFNCYFVDPSISVNETKNIDKVVEDLHKIYDIGTYSKERKREKIDDKYLVKDTDSKILITEYVDTKLGVKAETPILQKVLNDLGYSFPNISSSLKTIITRDWSVKTPEAQAIYDRAKKAVDDSDVHFSTLADEFKKQIPAIKAGQTGFFFAGPPGTGKSEGTRALAVEVGAPWVTMAVMRGTDERHIFGEWVMDPSTGKFRFQNSVLIEAYEKGYAITIDEINTTSQDVMIMFHPFLDGTPYIKTEDGVVHYKNKNFFAMFTQNSGLAGTQEITPALKDRCVVIQLLPVTQDQFCEWLDVYVQHKYSITLSRKFYEKLYDFGKYMEGIAPDYGENVSFGIRQAKGLMTYILSSRLDEDGFDKAIEFAYINVLSLDNDNTSELETLKKDATLKDRIKQVYDVFDYKIPTTVEIVDEYDETEEVAEPEEASATTKAGLDPDAAEIADDLDEAFK